MHILLIVVTTLIHSTLVLLSMLCMRRAEAESVLAAKARDQCLRQERKLLDERARVTVCERELDALRRELRKLAGKFYASQREHDDDEFAQRQRGIDHPNSGDLEEQVEFCENYGSAQLLGPASAAAQCQCGYCLTRRSERDAMRKASVPKTVQGQARLATLNAGKP